MKSRSYNVLSVCNTKQTQWGRRIRGKVGKISKQRGKSLNKTKQNKQTRLRGTSITDPGSGREHRYEVPAATGDVFGETGYLAQGDL